MTSHKVRRLTASLALAGTLFFVNGCPENASDLVESPSAPSQDFPVASAYVEPIGSYALERVPVLFDTTLADAFGRSVPGNDPFYFSTARGDAVDGTDFGPGWNFGGFERNSTTDTRLPALSEDDASLPSEDGFVVGDPAEVGGDGLHNPFTEGLITGLQPNTTYIVAFARLGTVINAELDGAASALGEVVTAPDELLYVEGVAAGDPALAIESFPTFVDFQVDANPYVLGNFTTDANGEGFFDAVVDGSGGELYQTTSGDPSDADFDLSLVARNDDMQTTFPRYNYLIIFEGPAVDASDAADNPQALRIQLGQDFIASNGELINNAYAPFPTQIPADEISGAPGFLGARPDSLQATFSNLEELAGGSVYQGWLVNPGTGRAVPAVGTYFKIMLVPIVDPVTEEVIGFEQDTIETVAGTSSFVGGNEGDGFLHSLVTSDATLGAGDSVGLHTHFTLTITDAPGSSLPDARPFWFQYTDQNGTPDDFSDDEFFLDGPTRFGNFDAATSVASRVYSGEGQGLGGVRENVLSVDIRRLSRPPVGYSLVGWLRRLDGEVLRLPEITGPPPDFVSLVDADVETIEGIVTENGILDANFRVEADSAALDFTGLVEFLITLEPKAGIPAIGPIPVQTGVIPETVRRRGS